MPSLVDVLAFSASCVAVSLALATVPSSGTPFLQCAPNNAQQTFGRVKSVKLPHHHQSSTRVAPAPFVQSSRGGSGHFSLPLAAAVACAVVALRSRVIRRGKGKPQTTSGIRVRKPKNNALRNCSIATFEELTTRKRYEPLVFRWRQRLARPRHKKIGMATRTSRQIGHKGMRCLRPGVTHAKMYRIIDFSRSKRGIFGKIETIEYDPFRNARICLVKYEDGEKRYILFGFGYFVGQELIAAEDAPIYNGNAMPLDKVPLGTLIHNVAARKRGHGQLARAAGTAATVLNRDEKYVTVKLPSAEVRMFPKECWCTIGKVGRTEAQLIKLGKAGKSQHLQRRPHTRGSAKNACDHPHGGGEGRSPIGLPHPKTPFGRCALGSRTRKKHLRSDKLILIKRKRKSGKPW